GVVRHAAVVHGQENAGGGGICRDALRPELDGGVVDDGHRRRSGDARLNEDAGPAGRRNAVVPEEAVVNVQELGAGGGGVEANPVRLAGVEVLDDHIVQMQREPTGEVDADQAGAGAVDGETAHVHDDGSGRRRGAVVDVYTVGAGRQDGAERAAAVEGYRLGDGDGAEAARIEAVDLTAGGGLRDRSGEGLARRCAAARVNVVADARYPGSRRLRMRRTHSQHGHRGT